METRETAQPPWKLQIQAIVSGRGPRGELNTVGFYREDILKIDKAVVEFIL